MGNTFTTTTASGSLSDTYSTDTDLDNAFGPDNVTAWADLNDNGDAGEIATRKAWARGEGKTEIDDAFWAAGLPLPTPDNFPRYASLAGVETSIAGFKLHRSRGITNQQGGPNADEMQSEYDRAIAKLKSLITGAQANDADDATAPAGTFQSVPLRYDPATTCDEYTA